MIDAPREAVERANASEGDDWSCHAYDPQHRALVFGRRGSAPGRAHYLICFQPTYVRVFRNCLPDVRFATGPESVVAMREPPPERFLKEDSVVLVITAGEDEYCVVCERLEFRTRPEERRR